MVTAFLWPSILLGIFGRTNQKSFLVRTNFYDGNVASVASVVLHKRHSVCVTDYRSYKNDLI